MFYHSELCATLKKLQYTQHIPTLHEFWIQLEETSILALAAIVCSRPNMTNSQNEDADIHSLFDHDERAKNYRRICLENKDLQTVLKKMLPVFDRRGLLDIRK
ncbi:uncharacterized protein LOC142220184 [Haematobia irritans]|uniref:uncharacterized protein LOC142220184 n=1 Tax=Haematobia irritans TaxID=7368 RepID=UPI003F4FB0A0